MAKTTELVDLALKASLENACARLIIEYPRELKDLIF